MILALGPVVLAGLYGWYALGFPVAGTNAHSHNTAAKLTILKNLVQASLS